MLVTLANEFDKKSWMRYELEEEDETIILFFKYTYCNISSNIFF